MLVLSEILASLPPEWADDLMPAIRAEIRASGRKLVVLDDDPTGTQTVSGIPVLTGWSVERLTAELSADIPAFYLLTNSRSLPLAQAQAVNGEIGDHLVRASALSGRDFAVLSRSDSTLRGHFPGELQALANHLPGPFDAWILAPFFLEGGRLTIHDIHYVVEGGTLVPAAETEFARDKTFGYQSSHLKAWVIEKSGGGIPAEQIFSISIDHLRLGGPDAVTRRLLSLPTGGSVLIVNAASYRDLEVFVLGLLRAEAAGRSYLYRSAASFARVRAGLSPRPLLSAAELHLPSKGAGLVVAGSYVPRTSAQLNALFEQTSIQPVEIQVPLLLDETRRAAEESRVLSEVNQRLEQGQDTVLYTSRALVSVSGEEANLAVGRIVSASLVAVVRGLKIRPRYLVAKGGITSSDIATQALDIRQALILGQILPGVPVWQTGQESRFPGMAYIIFPGNVGDANALVKIVRLLDEN